MTPERKLKNLLSQSGWELIRNHRHAIYRCPCGSHQTSIANSPSDKRGYRNKIAELKQTGCPSLSGLLE